MKKNQEKINTEYDNRYSQVAELIKSIQSKIEKEKNDTDKNWGHVGNIGLAIEELSNLNKFYN